MPENFHKPQPVEFSSPPGKSTPANTPEKGVKEGTSAIVQEGVKGSLNDTPDASDFWK